MQSSFEYTLEDLLYLMSRLRDPEQGCPWDLKQTARSIVNYSIEEVYELADAIEQGNSSQTRSELGDVLFQVVFLSRIAEEEGHFTFQNVVQTLCEKMLRRHPHVFDDGALYPDTTTKGETSNRNLDNQSKIDEKSVAQQWENIKSKERVANNQLQLFDDIPVTLPSFVRAAKLQKRATKYGLDWPDASGAMAKLQEEVDELKVHLTENESHINRQSLENELGDILFSCVNVARKLDLNADQALRQANRKFAARVERVKECLDQQTSNSQPRREMLDEIWEKVKLDLDGE